MNEETIFAAALEKKTPGERQAFLDAACAGDPSMRAAVEELLRADSDAGSFLDHPPIGPDATLASDANSRDTVDETGWVRSLPFLKPCGKSDRIGQIDQYEIIEVVGHGGMGAVLRAFDTKLSRVVAVKVMSPTLAANPTAVRRFLREAMTAAQIHHDHVVTIHAVDESHQPPYLVMQFVEGQTLQQKIDREGELDVKTILRIGSQAAAGLAAAHKLGLIHRDVKPANILLENGVERVKITDFGLARSADDLQITQTGLIAGTPQYMSPEQARGEPIDVRSDLFSLGSVLYTMCTGRPAFRADNPVAVLRRVCDDAPRPMREVNPEIPEWLEAIVGKLLAKNPADRFQSAAEIAELLCQHLAHVQNPAIAPRPMPVVAPVYMLGTSGLWRDGNLLVMHRNAPLPDICLKSNARSTRRLKRRVAWHHPAIYLAFFVNPLLYFILALVLQKSATIYIPLSDEWFLRRRQRMTFAWGAVLGGFALVWAFVRWKPTGKLSVMFDGTAEPLLMVLAGCLIMFGAVYGLLACRLVWAQRMRDDYIWLRGVNRELLARLEVWGLSPSGFAPPASIPTVMPAKQTEPVASPAPPFWMFAGGLALGVLAMFVAVLKVTVGFNTRAIEPVAVVVGFVFGTAVFAWTIANFWQRVRARRETLLDAHLRKPGSRGVFVEHPMLGVVAILMLMTSVGVATYMLTTARAGLAAKPATVSPARVDGWTQLFNGHDLTGWKSHPSQPGSWKVENGELVGSEATSHLFSERGDFQDFHLRVEAKISDGGESGVYFRVPEIALPRYDEFPEGYEANINSNHPTDEERTGSLTGSLRGVVHYKDSLHKPDEWFTLEIVAQGPHIVLRVNGQSTVDFRDANSSFRRGHLAIQLWPDESVVRIRKIEISEFSAAEAGEK
jgi:serine/threonine protein kinase